MSLDLFAGIYVSDFDAAKAWYTQFFGSEAAWAEGSEAVWELAESRSIVIEQNPKHAGHALQTFFVDDFESRIAEIAARGVEPVKRETYSNGVRKAVYRDPDGNEIGIGGAPI